MVQMTLADFSLDALPRLSTYECEEPRELMVAFDAGSPDLVPEPFCDFGCCPGLDRRPRHGCKREGYFRLSGRSSDDSRGGSPKTKPGRPSRFSANAGHSSAAGHWQRRACARAAAGKAKEANHGGSGRSTEALCATLVSSLPWRATHSQARTLHDAAAKAYEAQGVGRGRG